MHNQPYDVAILDVPDSIPETYFTICEILPARTGIGRIESTRFRMKINGNA